MACRYTFQGKTYEAWEFDDLLRKMPAAQLLPFAKPYEKPVPDAPFIGKTDGWLNLALKRVVGLAVDEGYDGVAFVNGKQAADRFNIGNVVDNITWTEVDGGKFIGLSLSSGVPVFLTIDAAGVVRKAKGGLSEALEKSLDQVVGKGLADRIMSEPSGDLEGEAMRIGDDGMVAFYDQIVPSAVKALTRKLGGGEVVAMGFREKTENYADPDTGEELPSGGDDMDLAQKGFAITDAMREKLSGGVPMFSRRHAEAAERAGFDTSKVWYHGTTAKAFRSFKPGKGGVDELGAGIYFTGDPGVAQAWAGRHLDQGGRLIPAYIRKGDIFDSSKPVDYEALARRIKERNPVTDIERRAKIIAETRPITEWTEEEKSVFNAANAEPWRSWLMESDKDMAAQIRRGGLNAWLSRAGYVGRVNQNSQIKDQVVVFRPQDIRAPWAKFSTKRADSPDFLASMRMTERTEFADWSDGLPLIENEGDYGGGPAVFVAYHGTTHGDITKFERTGNKEGFLGQGPYFTSSPDDASSNYAGEGPDLRTRISEAADNVSRDMDDDPHFATQVLSKYFTDQEVEMELNDETFDDAMSEHGGDAAEHWARSQLKGDNEGLVMQAFVKVSNPLDTVNGELTYELIEDENGDVIDEAGSLVDWVLAIREVAGYRGLGREVENYINGLMETSGDGYVSASMIIDLAREYLQDGYDDAGDSISPGQIVAEVAEQLGYDGIIMDANKYFGNRRTSWGARQKGMDGVGDGTLHIVPFNANQVKSATGNFGTFSKTNDDIRFSAHMTETEAFKRWFGDSKVVDAQGKPLVVYHGTRRAFSVFAKGKPRGALGNPEGIYFTSDRREAEQFAEDVDGGMDEKSRIVPVYLSIKSEQDGLIRKREDGTTEYIVFQPEQIKSAIGNRGTFDPENPDIRYSSRTGTPEFKRWFGDSKVVDANGKPLMVYTGTSKDVDFKSFKMPKNGVWFTTRPDVASSYALDNDSKDTKYNPETRRYEEVNTAARVIPAYLRIEKPYKLTQEEYDRINTDNYRAAQGRVFDEIRARGYDGIDWGGGIWVAIKEPAQIKSAVGNRGTFDPRKTDIALSAWDAPEPSRFDDFVYKAQDKLVDLKRITQSIKKAVGGLAEDVDAYLQEELYHGRAAKRTHDFGAQELQPLMEQIAASGLTMGDVEEYLHARHAKEANRVIAQRNPGVADLQDGGSGMKDADADAYMASLTPELRRKLESVAARVDDIISGTRQLFVQYGLESQQTVDGWASLFQHYIPLQREDKDGNGGMSIGQGFSVKGKETKGRTGSTRKVVDILANIALQRERVIVRGEKNRVAKSLLGMAALNPNPGFWQVGPPPAERAYDPKTNTVVERVDPMYRMRPNVVMAKVQNPDGSVREIGVVFNEDNPRAMRLATAMKNLDAPNLEGVLGMSAKVTRYFAAINTQYNPVFGVVNLLRDVQGAMINLGGTPLAGQHARIAKDTFLALKGIYGDLRAERRGQQASSQWAALWEDFQSVGGKTGFRELFRTSSDRAEALQKIVNPDAWMDSPWGKVFTANGSLKMPVAQAKRGAEALFDWLSDYNEALENGVRLAAYKAGLDQGMSKRQAASLAKNLTVNFNRKGQVGAQAGAVYAFFNAAMQGSARLGQLLFTMDDGKLNTLRLSKTGQKVVYGGMLLGVMQALMLAAAGFDDEDPPGFVRERSLVIPIGDKKYVTIPMPLGLHVIPGVGRHFTEFALSGFEKPAQRVADMMGMFADAFNPIGNAGLSMQTIAPTILDPMVALTENRDWTGKPIARTSMNEATPGHALHKDTASSWGKVISEAINWATGGNEYVAGVLSPTPDQIDYLIGQVTGGVGREISKLDQSARAMISGEELPTFKVPLVGRFVGDAASQASEGTAFYANVARLNELETEVKGLRGDGRLAEAQQLLAGRPDAYLIAMANAAERQIQRLRREKRALVEEGAPRERVREVEQRITEAMARLNRAVERAEGQRSRS